MQILSSYQLKKVDYEFLSFFDQYIAKFPFKCYNLMDIFLTKEIVYIKDTTMIIDLIKINEDNIIKSFDFLKEMLRNKLLKKIIYKKEVLLVYFFTEFIISFFQDKNKWLLIPLITELNNLNYKCYFNSYIKTDNIYKFMYLVIIDNYFVSIDVNFKIKLSVNHIPLVINFYNNKDNFLMFSFDKNEFIKNFRSKIKL